MQARLWDSSYNPALVRRSCITARRFLEWFYRLREVVEGLSSATGFQIELARQSVDGSLFIRDDSNLYGAVGRASDRMAKFAIGAQIYGALAGDEQRIFEMRHGIVSHNTIRCERRHADIVDGDGMTVVDLCRDGETGELNGWVVVDALNPVSLTNAEIAERMGTTESRVRAASSRGYRKIDDHPLLKAIWAVEE